MMPPLRTFLVFYCIILSLISTFAEVTNFGYNGKQGSKFKTTLKPFNDSKAIWVRTLTDERVPDHAVTGGCDRQGPLYIARINADIDGRSIGWVNGKFSPVNQRFYIAHNGKEYTFDDRYIEVLTHKNHSWIPYIDGGDRIVGAIKPDGSKYYICRARAFGCKHPGKLDGNVCFVPHATEEKQFYTNYEVLVDAGLQ